MLWGACSRAGDAERMVKVALDEVRQLDGQMNLLERKFQLPNSQASSAMGLSPRTASASHRAHMGALPWSPSGHHLVTHIERPPTNVLVSPF